MRGQSRGDTHEPAAQAPLSTYVLTVHSEKPRGIGDGRLTDAFVAELVENITDLLPDGWWVEINEWDAPVGSVFDRYLTQQLADPEFRESYEIALRDLQREGDDDA